jgi:hypothetical protein
MLSASNHVLRPQRCLTDPFDNHLQMLEATANKSPVIPCVTEGEVDPRKIRLMKVPPVPE